MSRRFTCLLLPALLLGACEAVGTLGGAIGSPAVGGSPSGSGPTLVPPVGDPEPESTGAEGQPCSGSCQPGLSCVAIAGEGDYCLEQCTSVGTDPRCDGDESCVSSAGGAVCFAANRPQSGFAHVLPGDSYAAPEEPGEPGGPAAEGQSCTSRACGSNLACAPVYEGSSLAGKFCLERCTNPGIDLACDGTELCVVSPAGGSVCFAADRQAAGYANAQGEGYDPPPGTPPPGTPPGTPPADPPPQDNFGSCGNADESKVFELLNQARAQHGLGGLQCDQAGLQAARAHSQDMCDRGYFSHTSLDGRSHMDRLQAAGANFGGAGENIAMGQTTAVEVHETWMNSSGHRSNILNGSWTRAAIGLVRCNGGTPYWTEVFLD